MWAELSPVPMVDCTSTGSQFDGCNGSSVIHAYNYAKSNGMVDKSCDPFTTSVWTACGSSKCANSGNGTPSCTMSNSCSSADGDYDPTMLDEAKSIFSCENNFKNAVYNHGPFTISIRCYSDL